MDIMIINIKYIWSIFLCGFFGENIGEKRQKFCKKKLKKMLSLIKIN